LLIPLYKTSLKTPKGQSEAVNLRTTATQRPKQKWQMDKQWSTKHYT